MQPTEKDLDCLKTYVPKVLGRVFGNLDEDPYIINTISSNFVIYLKKKSEYTKSYKKIKDQDFIECTKFKTEYNLRVRNLKQNFKSQLTNMLLQLIDKDFSTNNLEPVYLSKSEEIVHEFLLTKYSKSSISVNFSFDWFGQQQRYYDFVIKADDQPIIIEVDGPQHFKEIYEQSLDGPHHSKKIYEQSFEETRAIDIEKMAKAIENGYRFIRIPTSSIWKCNDNKWSVDNSWNLLLLDAIDSKSSIVYIDESKYSEFYSWS